MSFQRNGLTSIDGGVFGTDGNLTLLGGLNLDNNLNLTTLNQTAFSALFTRNVREGIPFKLSCSNCPLKCCPLAWMFLEGALMGDDYRNQVVKLYLT